MNTTYNKSKSGTDNLGLFSLGKGEIYHNDRDLMADYFAVVESCFDRESKKTNIARRDGLLRLIDAKIADSSGRGKYSYILRYLKAHKLTDYEKMALAYVSYAQANAGEVAIIEDIYSFISGGDRVIMLSLPKIFSPVSNLVKSGMIFSFSVEGLGNMGSFGLGLRAKRSLYGYRDAGCGLDNVIIGKGFRKRFKYKADNQSYKMLYDSPKSIYQELSKYVVGQDQAKYRLSVAAYNHCLRITGKIAVKKSNIFMSGPTGCGKTFLMETLSKILNLPVFIADATNYTEAGYVGYDVEDILKGLYLASGENGYMAEKGMVFIDEVDKIAASYDSGKHKGNRDVSGVSVQEELLRVLEGGSFPNCPFDTSNVLFIAGGAFSDLAGQSETKRTIGFGRCENSSETRRMAGPGIDGFVKYGMLPEFMGRFPIRLSLDALGIDSLRKILTAPENSLINQYRELFGSMGITLQVDDAALDMIVDKAARMKTGARALKSVVEDVFSPLIYEHFGNEAKGRKVVVSPAVINA